MSEEDEQLALINSCNWILTGIPNIIQSDGWWYGRDKARLSEGSMNASSHATVDSTVCEHSQRSSDISNGPAHHDSTTKETGIVLMF